MSIGRLKSPVNLIDLFAMTNERSYFGRGMAGAEEPGDDGDTGAMDRVRESAPAEEVAPAWRPHVWKRRIGEQTGAALLAGFADQGKEIRVQGLCVVPAAFDAKGDGAGVGVYAIEGDVGFADAAALAHEDEPLGTHPRGFFLKGCLDDDLMIGGDLEFLFGRLAAGFYFATGVAGGVASLDGFRHEYLKVEEAEFGGVDGDGLEGLAAGAPRDEAGSVFVGELRGGSDGARAEVGEEIAQGFAGVGERAGVLVAIGEKGVGPGFPAFAFASLRGDGLSLGVFGFLPPRQARGVPSIKADASGFTLDSFGRRVAVFDPVEGRLGAGVDGGHGSSVPSCAQVVDSDGGFKCERQSGSGWLSLYGVLSLPEVLCCIRGELTRCARECALQGEAVAG